MLRVQFLCENIWYAENHCYFHRKLFSKIIVLDLFARTKKADTKRFKLLFYVFFIGFTSDDRFCINKTFMKHSEFIMMKNLITENIQWSIYYLETEQMS